MSDLWNEAYAAAGPSRDDMWDWLEARLRTVEAERNEWKSQALGDERDWLEQIRALEAALRPFATGVEAFDGAEETYGDGPVFERYGKAGHWAFTIADVRAARAALAVSGNQP